LNRRVVVDPAADRDLDDQFDYIARDSLEVALRLLTAADRTFEELARMPRMGAPKEFRNPRLAGVRQWRICGFDSHLIFYREVEDGIEVLRVLHAARDIEHILEEWQG
jgi:toxin ParE1/3/4